MLDSKDGPKTDPKRLFPSTITPPMGKSLYLIVVFQGLTIPEPKTEKVTKFTSTTSPAVKSSKSTPKHGKQQSFKHSTRLITYCPNPKALLNLSLTATSWSTGDPRVQWRNSNQTVHQFSIPTWTQGSWATKSKTTEVSGTTGPAYQTKLQRSLRLRTATKPESTFPGTVTRELNFGDFLKSKMVVNPSSGNLSGRASRQSWPSTVEVWVISKPKRSMLRESCWSRHLLSSQRLWSTNLEVRRRGRRTGSCLGWRSKVRSSSRAIFDYEMAEIVLLDDREKLWTGSYLSSIHSVHSS